MSPRRILILLFALSVALVGCGGGADEQDTETSESMGEVGDGSLAATDFEQTYTDVDAYPVFVSNELVIGKNRFVVGLLDAQDAPLADPSIEMEVTFFDLTADQPEEIVSEDMTWVWIEEGVRGYYIGNVEFPRAGEVGAQVELNGGGIEETLRAKVEVIPESSTPHYGEKPPASDTPTLADAKDLEEISTDSSPDRRFYRYSIAEALKRNAPSVVIFATPKFCASAVCAPTLDNVQEVSDEFPKASFVHVEPYELDKLPEQLVPVESMLEWKLPTEPWVFVMDAEGKVVAKYEGVMAPDELRDVLSSAS